MVRRLTPFIVAVMLAFAPAALVFCEASCTGHVPAASTVDHAAHHHHQSPLPQGTTDVVSHHGHHESLLPPVTTDAQAASHRCTQGDGLPVAASVSLTTTLAPAVLSIALVLPDQPTTSVPWHDVAFRAPPHPSALITQLRV